MNDASLIPSVIPTKKRKGRQATGNEMANILIIEDDKSFCAMLVDDTLKDSGHEVLGVQYHACGHQGNLQKTL